MVEPKKKIKILVVAGEASADLHAAHVLERLSKTHDIEVIGIGGDRLMKLGLTPIRHARQMAVVGLTEALKKIPQTLRIFSELEILAREEKPDFVLLLDLPDFNLRLAPKLKRIGLPIIYYISPQVWAWRSRRVKQMAKNIDLLLCILPFEVDWYNKNAPSPLKVKYVGHPVLEEIPDLPFEPREEYLVIMPGSRDNEWKNLFGPMIEAAALLGRGNSQLQFTLPLAETMRSTPLANHYLSSVGPYGDAIRSLGNALKITDSPAHECLRRAKAAWIASGTATLEAALVGTPMVVAYKVSAGTAFLFRNLVRYRGPIAMVNIIHRGLGSEERLVPELLQEAVEPFQLASAMREVLQEKNWQAQRSELSGTRDLLKGEGRPLDNTVKAITQFLQELK